MAGIESKCTEPEIDYNVLNSIIVDRYNQNRENLIMMMQAIQKQYRYLPITALRYLSDKVQVPLIKIFEIATFYASFSLKPKGKNIINICTGTACHLKGTGKMVEHITSKVGIKSGETTPDMLLTMDNVNCVGACAVAPVIVFNEKYYPEADLSVINTLLDQAKSE